MALARQGERSAFRESGIHQEIHLSKAEHGRGEWVLRGESLKREGLGDILATSLALAGRSVEGAPGIGGGHDRWCPDLEQSMKDGSRAAASPGRVPGYGLPGRQG